MRDHTSFPFVPSAIVVPARAAVLLGVLVGCGGSSSSIAPDAAADTGLGTDGGVSGDGSSDGAVDGQVITDGGSNLEVDGGDDDGGDDTAPDGGACNTIVDDSTAVASTCASVEPMLAGGSLVAGRYHLTAVTAYESAAFCQMGFIPVGIRETAVMTVAGGVGSVETVSQLEMNKEKRDSETLTPGSNDASPLTAAITCPATTGSAQVKYSSTTTGAKTVLILRRGYGKAEADYTFESQ